MEADLMDSSTTAVPDVEHTEAGLSVPRLFEERARIAPDAVAVSDPAGSLTYAELNAAANRLADLLVERGAGPELSLRCRIPAAGPCAAGRAPGVPADGGGRPPGGRHR